MAFGDPQPLQFQAAPFTGNGMFLKNGVPFLDPEHFAGQLNSIENGLFGTFPNSAAPPGTVLPTNVENQNAVIDSLLIADQLQKALDSASPSPGSATVSGRPDIASVIAQVLANPSGASNGQNIFTAAQQTQQDNQDVLDNAPPPVTPPVDTPQFNFPDEINLSLKDSTQGPGAVAQNAQTMQNLDLMLQMFGLGGLQQGPRGATPGTLPDNLPFAVNFNTTGTGGK